MTRDLYHSIMIISLLLLTLTYSCEHHHHHDHDQHHHHHHHQHNNHDNEHHENHQHDHNHDHQDNYQPNENNHNHNNKQDKEQQKSVDSHDNSREQQIYTHSHKHSHTHSKQNTQFKMIQNKPHLMESLKLSPISVFFYGYSQTPQYQQFQSMLPSYNSQFYQNLPNHIEFYFLPAQKFNLTRPNPSLSIYRKINNGQWLMYKGIFQKTQMINWVIKNTVDPLRQLNGQQIDAFFVDSKKGFILLQFGQFYLLKTKIMIHEFCSKYEIVCGKVTHHNKALNMVIQLMRAQKQPGVPKLGFWNPKTQQLQIYTKDPSQITQNQLMQLYSGHESVIPYQAELDVAEAIHPETQFVELNQPKQNLEL